MELIHILKCCFHSDAVTLPLEIDHIMKCFLRFIQILYKSYQPVRLMVYDMFYFRTSPVFENDGQFRIQIGRLMHAALDFLCLKTSFFKNLRIRQKVNLCSGLSCLSDGRKQAIDQFNRWISSFIMVMMDITVPGYFNIQIGGQSIDHRRTYSMKSTASLIYGIIKFSACMKCRKYQTFC